MNKKSLLSIVVLCGYNQASLAKAINMGKNTISRKINGKADFNTREIDAICSVLNISDPETKAKIFLSH